MRYSIWAMMLVLILVAGSAKSGKEVKGNLFKDDLAFLKKADKSRCPLGQEQLNPGGYQS